LFAYGASVHQGAGGCRDQPRVPDRAAEGYETRAAGVDEQLGKLDEAGWEKTAKFLLEGKVVWEDTLGNMVWGFLFDAIHHRGQLSTYLRPMGSKVPSIYGPSADDPGEQ
jgi:uncharacterized damage-inducible protein DinB